MFKKKKTSKNAPRQRPASSSGSSGNKAVFSYYSGSRGAEGKSQSKEQRPSQSKRIGWRALLMRTAILLIIGLGLYSLFVSDDPTVVVGGSQESHGLLKDKTVYAEAAAELLDDSVLNRNKLTVDASGVAASLSEQFPELARASITLPLYGHEPTVHIQAFDPKLILVSGSGTFLLDYQGRAILPTNQVPTLDRFKLPVVRDETGLDIELGDYALPERQVAFISEVSGQLRAKKTQVANISLPPGGGELIVQIKDSPYRVRFNLHDDAREGVGRYLAARDYLKAQDRTPKNYIDVRVDDRVYYR